MYANVSHVIFDLDGLLLDTEKIFEKIACLIAEEHGKEHTWEIQLKIMGKTADVGAQIILEETGIPLTVNEYRKKTTELCEQFLPAAEISPGVEKLVRHLKRHNIPMAVATSSSGHSIQMKTARHLEFFSIFDHVISSIEEPEVKRSKPFPDIFLFCASRFTNSPQPNKILVFEDSYYGKEAAVAAGMPVVMIPDQRLDRSLTSQATLVIESMEQFQPQDFGLPPYSNE